MKVKNIFTPKKRLLKRKFCITFDRRTTAVQVGRKTPATMSEVEYRLECTQKGDLNLMYHISTIVRNDEG
jgi:hypothetical protein